MSENVSRREISICIPTYEFKGEGVKYLSELLDTLQLQNFDDFNVVVSDHSVDDKIYDLCKEKSKLFEIIYVRNEHGRGNLGPNTNVALENGTGRILKVVYQDDLFVNRDALQVIKDAYDTGCKWAFNSFCHTRDGVLTFRDVVPRWGDKMLEGRNLLGNPSGLSVLNRCKMYMREDLNLLVDTDLYHRMRMEHGLPYIIEDVLTATREHENRTSASRIVYDHHINHPEGGWVVNKAELDLLHSTYKEFFEGGEKYPDEA
jgi:glycosyltransferase involved in cell wall biosynthesis